MQPEAPLLVYAQPRRNKYDKATFEVNWEWRDWTGLPLSVMFCPERHSVGTEEIPEQHHEQGFKRPRHSIWEIELRASDHAGH
jgi:hypothetical protein